MWNILTRPGFHCCCWEIQCNSDFPTVSYIWFSSLHPKIFFFLSQGLSNFLLMWLVMDIFIFCPWYPVISFYCETQSFGSDHAAAYPYKIIFLSFPFWRTCPVWCLFSWTKPLFSHLFSFCLLVHFFGTQNYFHFRNYFWLPSILSCAISFSFSGILIMFQVCSILFYFRRYQ